MYLPGQFYTADQQCQFNVANTTYAACKVGFFINLSTYLLLFMIFKIYNDTICQTLYCGTTSSSCFATSSLIIFCVIKFLYI